MTARARTIVRALGGRWHGNYGMARCPAHDDGKPSLSVAERDGRILFYCHAGCDQARVIDALRAHGLWEHGDKDAGAFRDAVSTTRAAQQDNSTSAKTAAALEIWVASGSIYNSKGASYLRARGIDGDLPASLRSHRGLRHWPSGLVLPAMVAAVTAPDGKITAVHRTFLKPDGSGKAEVEPQKMALGPIGGGAVRLGEAGAVLGIAEGIETAFSAMRIFYLPCWAACGSRLDGVELPGRVRHVVIFADNGAPGHEAAAKAFSKYRAEKRRVTLKPPPLQFGDWNDALRAGRASWAA